MTLAGCSTSEVTAVGCGSYVDYGSVEAGAAHADLVATATFDSVVDTGDSAGIALTLENVVKGHAVERSILVRVDLHCDTPSNFVPHGVKAGDEVIALLRGTDGAWTPLYSSDAITPFDQTTLDAIEAP